MRLTHLIAAATVFSSACTAPDLATPNLLEPPQPSAEILDDARGGGSGFYFLPPLVPAPQVTGEFDVTALADLTVEVCEWVEGACASVIAVFSDTAEPGEPVIKLDPVAESYSVVWMTRESELAVDRTYRIRVLRSGLELGHADLDVVASGHELKNVDAEAFIPLKVDGVLPIAFRVEVREGVTIDATALSTGNFLIGGLGFFETGVVQTLDLEPGAYVFAEQSGGSFDFTVMANGTVDYANTLDGFVSGRGTTGLVVHGYDIMVDAAALTVPNFLIGGVGFRDGTVVQTLTHVPGTKAFAEQSGGSFDFMVGADGTIDYDAGLDGFVSGRGTTGLVVHGFDVTIDATSLTVPNFLIGGAGFQDGTVVQTLTLVPGTKAFAEQSGGSFDFMIGADGTIDYDAGLDGFVSGRGATGLVVHGFDVTIDATALTVPNFLIGGAGFQDGTMVQTLTHVPGTKAFAEQSGGSFDFIVGLDGTIDYGAALDGFLSGRGTTGLVVHGFDVTVDATSLTVPNFLIGGAGFQDGTMVQTLTHVPGTKAFAEQSGGSFDFTIGPDGAIDYAVGLDGFLAGRGTTALVVQGYTISIDATALGVPTFLLGGAGVFDATVAQPVTHVPGSKAFSSSVLSFDFMVLGDGALDYDAGLDGQVEGRGTTTLTISP